MKLTTKFPSSQIYFRFLPRANIPAYFFSFFSRVWGFLNFLPDSDNCFLVGFFIVSHRPSGYIRMIEEKTIYCQLESSISKKHNFFQKIYI